MPSTRYPPPSLSEEQGPSPTQACSDPWLFFLAVSIPPHAPPIFTGIFVGETRPEEGKLPTRQTLQSC